MIWQNEDKGNPANLDASLTFTEQKTVKKQISYLNGSGSVEE